MFSRPIDPSEQPPRMHGPVTDGWIAYTLDGLKKCRRGHLSEAILLIEAIQYERQMTLAASKLVASPRRDWTEDWLREQKQPGVYCRSCGNPLDAPHTDCI